MFNEEQKKEYIDYVLRINQGLRYWINRVFNDSEKKERYLGRDIAEWTGTEIMSYYKSLCVSSLNSLNFRHSQLSNYARWCLNRNLIKDNQNHYIEIGIEALQNCINLGRLGNGILSREDLETVIMDLLNPRDQCLLYALFEGIQGKGFCELSDLNVSQLEGNKLYLPDRTIEVPDRLIGLMQEASEEYIYYAYGEKQWEIHYPKDDTNVFKMLPNARKTTQERKRQRVYSNLVRIKKHIGNPAINAQSLKESGRIEMVCKLLKENEDLDLYEVLHKYNDEISNKYGIIHSYTNYILAYGRFYEEK